ncbi:MAG TPA: hypothetical protein VEQ12_06865 [Candidatus Limnocylindria bacterium]|nr:hypothetical protein [Candidatus Limnocylindria bacterium]
MKTEMPTQDKPWRPGDHPRPGPSWASPEEPTDEHKGEPDAED